MRRFSVFLTISALFIAANQSQAANQVTDYYDDPFAYCAAAGTIDRPGKHYTGSEAPDSILQQMGEAAISDTFVWRCVDGKVFSCAFYRDYFCDRLGSDPDPGPLIAQTCRETPNQDFTPGYYSTWACRGGVPILLESKAQLDAQGFVAEVWFEVPPPAGFQPSAPAPVASNESSSQVALDLSFDEMHNQRVSVCAGCSGRRENVPEFSKIRFEALSPPLRGELMCVDIRDQSPFTGVYITYTSALEPILLSDDQTSAFLNRLRLAISKRCEEAFATGHLEDVRGNSVRSLPEQILVAARDSANYQFQAYSNLNAGNWTIPMNRPKERQAQQLAAIQQQQQIANSKQQVRQEFLSQYGVSELISVEQFASNPFLFDGQTIGVKLSFNRMIAKDQAIFAGGNKLFQSIMYQPSSSHLPINYS